jgi:hypothetical protein
MGGKKITVRQLEEYGLAGREMRKRGGKESRMVVDGHWFFEKWT